MWFNPWEEIWYYPSAPRKFTRTDRTSERLALHGQTNNPDPSLLEALTADTGPLACGAMPALDLATNEGVKNLCSSLSTGVVVKPQAKPKPKNENAEEVTPATPKEHLGFA